MAFYRATQKETFHIWGDYVNGVTIEDSKAIGQSKAYDEHSFKKPDLGIIINIGFPHSTNSGTGSQPHHTNILGGVSSFWYNGLDPRLNHINLIHIICPVSYIHIHVCIPDFLWYLHLIICILHTSA